MFDEMMGFEGDATREEYKNLFCWLGDQDLKKLAKKLDTSIEYEFLWSEPTNGDYASPVPILIQQDRRKLFDLRFDTGYYDDIIG